MNSRTLITAVTAFAVSSSAFAYRAPSGTHYRAQARVVDNRGVVGNNTGYGTSDRDLKQAIKAKRKQARQFRKAGDPRAAQAEQELRVLQDRQRQWHASNHNKKNNRNADDRNLTQQNGRDGDREGDRVHGKQKKSEKDHEKQNDEHDNKDNQDR